MRMWMTHESNRIDVAYNRLKIRDIKPKKGRQYHWQNSVWRWIDLDWLKIFDIVWLTMPCLVAKGLRISFYFLHPTETHHIKAWLLHDYFSILNASKPTVCQQLSPNYFQQTYRSRLINRASVLLFSI